MEKVSLQDLENDLKVKRDSLFLAHEDLKNDNDWWNKLIIIMSLINGGIESVKMQLEWDDNVASLLPIFISSTIAICSALVKFKKFPEQMEVLIKSSGIITNTLTKIRNHKEITEQLYKEYNDSLEQVETALYPDLRRKFLHKSHKNLMSIYKLEEKYYKLIEKLNNKEDKILTDQPHLALDLEEEKETPSPKRLATVIQESIRKIERDVGIQTGHNSDDSSLDFDVSQPPKIDTEFQVPQPPKIDEEFKENKATL
jgi:hypothetical protein